MRRAPAAALLAAALAGCLGPVRRIPAPPPEAARVPMLPPSPPLAGPPFAVLIAGDVMPAHRLDPYLRAHGASYPHAGLAKVLAGADLLFFNLEVPVGKTADPFPKKYNFLMDPAHAAVLVPAGLPVVVGLANNHILDHGPVALSETLAVLDKNGIARCGAGRDGAEARRPALVVVNGSTVAFLAYSHTQPEEFYAGPGKPGTAFASEEAVRRDVAAARPLAQRVIVAFHWGMEYSPEVFPHQRELALAALEAGADLVVGHHAHTVQGSEIWGGKPAVYGLGNFIFGTGNEKARGAVLRAVFEGTETRLELVPLDVNNFRTTYQPRPFEGEALAAALDETAALAPSIPWRRRTDRLVWP